MALREDVLASAVSFLKNEKVQSSPLARRITFLESKGLTNEEIEEALARASGKSKVTAPVAVAVAAPPPIPPPPPPSTFAERVATTSWKDAFIGAIVVGGLGYAALVAIQTYLLPSLNWPSVTQLEDDKKALDSKMTETNERLTSVNDQTTAVLTSLEAQSAEVNSALKSMHDTLKDLSKAEREREDEVRELKRELENIKSAIPKAIEKTKEDQKYSLAELQTEIKSLKGLLLNRRPTGPSMGAPGATPLASSALNSSKGMASIPSWQKAPASLSTEDTSLSGTTQPTATTTTTTTTTTAAITTDEPQSSSAVEQNDQA